MRRAGEVRRRPNLCGEGEEEGVEGEEEARSTAGHQPAPVRCLGRGSAPPQWRCGREGGSEQVEAGATVRVSDPRRRKESASFCTCSVRRGGRCLSRLYKS